MWAGTSCDISRMSECHPLTTQMSRKEQESGQIPLSVSVSGPSVTFLHRVWTRAHRGVFTESSRPPDEGVTAASAALKLSGHLCLTCSWCLMTAVWKHVRRAAGLQRQSRSSRLPAPASAENTPLPNEGIYSAAPRNRRGQPMINSALHAHLSATDSMKMFHSERRPSKDYTLNLTWRWTASINNSEPNAASLWCLQTDFVGKQTKTSEISAEKLSAFIPSVQTKQSLCVKHRTEAASTVINLFYNLDWTSSCDKIWQNKLSTVLMSWFKGTMCTIKGNSKHQSNQSAASQQTWWTRTDLRPVEDSSEVVYSSFNQGTGMRRKRRMVRIFPGLDQWKMG